ncbi:hypothetical protein [Actinocorallia aurantiaca]|uniref:Core-binding (CB) domain-containing protein n=1 Tax=Actinocorallia aurantiaca TaxID=46204 RepID=A0ABN3UBT5_9ACTN
MSEVTALIRQATLTSGALPDPETVRQRYRHRLPLDGSLTVGEWLDRWLDGRRNLRLSTRTGYACHIRLYLKPHLGHLRLDQLHSDDVHAMFEAIDVHNETIRAARTSVDTMVCASVRYRKPTSVATKRRICSLLRGALNTALDRRYVDHNAAAHIELDPAAPPKALLWTDERVAHWHRTGQTPSPIMVWTPELTRAFLGHSATDPYYPLFHLLTHLGLHCGEAAGLRWSDLDERTRQLSIERQLVVVNGRLHLWAPKTIAARRGIPSTPPPSPSCGSSPTATVVVVFRSRVHGHPKPCARGGRR